MTIVTPVLVLGIMGLLFGAFLGLSAKAFKVDEDERIEQISELLPGANCGGCGFAGCSSLADAIVKGEADVNACPGAKQENKEQIAAIMGVELKCGKQMIARVLCHGTCDVAKNKCEYSGINDCASAKRYGGGEKACEYSCMGLGSCVEACKFDAIHIVDGVALVNEEKCVACGICVNICPQNVINIMPKEHKTYVACISKDKGAEMKDKCSAGCIGCKICEKTCEYEAVSCVDNLARIDYEKCTDCGACAEKCPKKIIVH